MTEDEFSGDDIKAICTEALSLALSEQRMKATQADFKKAKDKVMFKKKRGSARRTLHVVITYCFLRIFVQRLI
ncbi:hypothetical protein P3S67_007481 [Capsicum chacoense]